MWRSNKSKLGNRQGSLQQVMVNWGLLKRVRDRNRGSHTEES